LFNSELLSRCVRLDVFFSSGKLQFGFLTYCRHHPQGCLLSSRSDKGHTIVLIQVFMDGGFESGLKPPVFLPASEGVSYLVCTLGLERAFILTCFVGRWYVDLLRVDSWFIHRGLDLYLRGCYNPFMLFLIFISPVLVDLHFVDKLIRYMSLSFFMYFFSLF